MFGFISINRDALDDAEYNRYLQVYCGQCHMLGKRLGQRTRLALSHDMTFLALLLLSLYEPRETHQVSGCPLHPLREQEWAQAECIDYAGDMTVALMYHKLADDWADDHRYLAAAGSRALEGAYAQVSARCPRQCRAIEQGLARITAIEADDQGNPDAAANVFGAIMGEIFAWREDHWADELRLLGCRIGRFIYLMDAAVDLEKDRESGSYNPFAKSELDPEEIKQLLMGHMSGVTEVFERLPLEQDIHLLRNVVYSGVWGMYNKMSAGQRPDGKAPCDDIEDDGEDAAGHIARAAESGQGEPAGGIPAATRI